MKLILFSILFWSVTGFCAANPADTVVRNLPFNSSNDVEPLTVTPAEREKTAKQESLNTAKKRKEASRKADEILGTPEPSNRAPDDGSAYDNDESPGSNQ